MGGSSGMSARPPSSDASHDQHRSRDARDGQDRSRSHRAGGRQTLAHLPLSYVPHDVAEDLVSDSAHCETDSTWRLAAVYSSSSMEPRSCSAASRSSSAAVDEPPPPAAGAAAARARLTFSPMCWVCSRKEVLSEMASASGNSSAIWPRSTCAPKKERTVNRSIHHGLLVAGIGAQMNSRTSSAAVIQYASSGRLRKWGARNRSPATAHRAGPANHADRITGMPMMITELATCTSSEVATE